MNWRVVIYTSVAFLISIPTALAQGEGEGNAALAVIIFFGLIAAVLLFVYYSVEMMSSETTSSEESHEFDLTQTPEGLRIRCEGEINFDNNEKLWVKYENNSGRHTSPFDKINPFGERDEAIIKTSSNTDKLKILRGENVGNLSLIKEWSDIPTVNNPSGVGRVENTSYATTCRKCDEPIKKHWEECPYCGNDV